MQDNDITFFLGQRWARALKSRFSDKNTAKHIASFFGVEVRTARSWLSGSTPCLKYIYIARMKLGLGFVLQIIAPDEILYDLSNVNIALEQLENKIENLKNKISDLK